MGMIMAVMMLVCVGVFVTLGRRNVVMMISKKSFDEEHHQHAGEKREHRALHGIHLSCGARRRRIGRVGGNHCGGCRGGVSDRMREHVEYGHAQHYARHEAYRELHPAMRELKPHRDHPADDRRDEDQRAIIGEQDEGHRVTSVDQAVPDLVVGKRQTQPDLLYIRNRRSSTKAIMRACIQRVSEARVTVDGELTGQIGPGLLVLLGVGAGDGEAELSWLVDKVIGLRIFEDDAGKMNRSLAEVGGAMLVVSQFTLYGDCRKGRRPSFTTAAPPELAERLYNEFVVRVRATGIEVATGRFREQMHVLLVNVGPVTLWIDTADIL
jgi:D-tyrosyl-tRNA(Tyr) deacylase